MSVRAMGFTLIELSVVLVIVGLILGGVLVGGELLHTAVLRKVIAEVNTYNTAVSSFRNKYNNLPGDMPRTEANTYFDFSSITGLGGACNGTSDGILSQNGQESSCFWIELYLAKMIAFFPKSSSCTGFSGNEDQEGYTVPQSSYSDVSGYKAINTGSWWAGSAATNRFILASRGGAVYGCAYRFYGGAVTPKDAYDIDSKIDDGSPNNARSYDAGSGESPVDLAHHVTASDGASMGSSSPDQTCYTGESYPTSGSYNIANSTHACVLRFLMNN